MQWWWSSDDQRSFKHSDSGSEAAPIPGETRTQAPDMPESTVSQEEKTAAELSHFMPVFSDSRSQERQETSAQPSARESLLGKLQIERKADSTPPSIAPFPDTMSCRQAFDDAFYCQSFGGQFINVYRYGSLRNCSESWSQFWFCMRTRQKPEDRKKWEIQEWYRKKELKYRGGPSSEDIWEERTEKVDRAFDWDPDKAGIFEERKREG